MQSQQPDPLDPLDLRCSDSDRERVAEVLRDAASDGRITLAELDERLHAAYAAKTFRDLLPVTQDLGLPAVPTHASAPVPVPTGSMERIGGVASSSSAVAIFGGAQRRGEWVVPEQFTAFAMFGGVDLDLRQARFATSQVTIEASAIFGGIDILVPDDVVVQVDGTGVFGGYDSAPAGNPVGNVPVVRVKGLALFGGVSVRRKRSGERPAIEGRHE